MAETCPDYKSTIESAIVEGEVAYWVCEDCGACVERKAHQATPQERLAQFENSRNIKLPASYLRSLEQTKGVRLQHGVVAVKEAPDGRPVFRYFDEWVEVGKFRRIEGPEFETIFHSNYLTREWELPEELALIEGDGHAWLALDYRACSQEPPVIFIESQDGSSVRLAESFQDLLELNPSADL